MSGLMENKVCIVTGAGRGIGQALATAFAGQGATVVANDLRAGCVDAWVAEAPQAIRDRVHPLYFDITDEIAVRTAALEIRKGYGGADVLVNNAGVEYNELIGMISQQNMERMFRVNVFGAIQMVQYVSRIMKSGASIINIASIVGVRGNRGQLAYSATKGAIIAMTKSAAKELAAKGIRVNAVAPGLTNTEMMRKADASELQGRIAGIALGRIAEPEDIANACVFLASDMAGYISGQVLGVDGCASM